MSKRKTQGDGFYDEVAPVINGAVRWPLELEPGTIEQYRRRAVDFAEAVAILRECHPFVTHDMLAQRVHAFVKAHE